MKAQSTDFDHLCYYFLMTHQVAFRDFFIPQCWTKIPMYKTRLYQMPAALSSTKVIKSGRGLGKSLEVEFALLQNAILKPDQETVISSFRRVHTKDRCESIIRYCLSIPYLKNFLDYRHVNRTPIYHIPFLNGHVIYGASVGDDPNATAILGKHPSTRAIDEMEVYPRSAWVQLNEARAETGSDDIFVGVPNGILGMPFTDIQKNPDYKNHFYQIPRYLNPYWNQNRKNEAILAYGGEDSDEYKQQILGEDGSPVQGAWDIEKIQKSMSKSVERYYREITPSVLGSMPIDDLLYDLPMTEGIVTMGIDVGYTEPTVICIFDYINEKYKLIARIDLVDKVIFSDQEEVIHYIAQHYHCNSISLDTTGADGRAIADDLANPKGKYIQYEYATRLVETYFSKKVQKGINPGTNEPIEEEIKPFTTIWLMRAFALGNFALPWDDDILAEFSQEKRKKTTAGRIVYTTCGTDHIISAFRCFALARFLETDPMGNSVQREYALPTWSQGVIYGSS